MGCGRRRRIGVGCGLPTWIGEAEECEGGSALQARSEGFNLERKAKTGEMWLLVRERGGGGRYFCGSQKFGIASAKKLARKVSLYMVPNSERLVDYSRRTFLRKPYAYYTLMVLQDILCCISHGWL